MEISDNQKILDSIIGKTIKGVKYCPNYVIDVRMTADRIIFDFVDGSSITISSASDCCCAASLVIEDE